MIIPHYKLINLLKDYNKIGAGNDGIRKNKNRNKNKNVEMIVVNMEWLFDCIENYTVVGFDDYIIE